MLGLLSLVFLIVTGLPALFLGLRSLRTINESDGRLVGRGLAIGGMVLGGVGTLGALLGLSWIVVTQLQNTSQRVSCTNNLRQLGQAIQAYQMQTKHFPRGTIPNDRLAPAERLSWNVSMLPYFMPDAQGPTAQKALFNQIDKESAWNAPVNRKPVETPVRFLFCPALPGAKSRRAPAVTTYPGMAGVGRDVAELPKEQNGVLTPHIGVFGYQRTLTPDDLARGLSYTMLVAETARQPGPWAAGGPSTVRGVDPAEQPFLGVDHPFGGLHAKGLNVLMADGSVHFLAETIPAREWETMATAADSTLRSTLGIRHLADHLD